MDLNSLDHLQLQRRVHIHVRTSILFSTVLEMSSEYKHLRYNIHILIVAMYSFCENITVCNIMTYM